jgi:mannose-6-phosphate isomerase-like protein (cupin superfamily)
MSATVRNYYEASSGTDKYREVQRTDDVALAFLSTTKGVGLEVHFDSTQIIRVEKGTGSLLLGPVMERGETKIASMRTIPLVMGTMMIIERGVPHEIIATDEGPLRLSVTYSPPRTEPPVTDLVWPIAVPTFRPQAVMR